MSDLADANSQKLYPIDANTVIVVGDNSIQLEKLPFLPADHVIPPGVQVIGGSDVKATAEDIIRGLK